MSLRAVPLLFGKSNHDLAMTTTNGCDHSGLRRLPQNFPLRANSLAQLLLIALGQCSSRATYVTIWLPQGWFDAARFQVIRVVS